MTTFGRPIAGALLPWMLIACLSGCSTTGPVAGGAERIGTLRTIGDNVFRNQRRADNGEGVYENDTVSTGPASSAVIELAGGGFVQLDENTDPEFRFEVVSDGSGRRCVHLYIKAGRVWVDSHVVCFETPDGAGIIDSVVNIEVVRGSTIVTVLSGRVLITRPREQPLAAGEQAIMARGGIEAVRGLSSEELNAVGRWRDRFARPTGKDRERGWCCSGNLEVFLGTPESCKRRRADFYPTEAEARKACAARPTEGWCCHPNGRVFFTTETQCKAGGGRLYKTQEDAENDRACRID